ncbi:MAG TPA: DsbA family oxidoreductase [Polyangiaceae bacterium]|nr:DsbA family oxidoreductase [Polyangiaceae bacterium]
MTKKLTVDVWSDIVCPWCAIGDRRLTAALAAFGHHDSVDVVWHAFELDPSAPAVRGGDHVEHLARKYGRSTAQARQMIQRVIDIAAQDGLDLKLFGTRGGNTFDAHRVLRLATERGLHQPVKERFFHAYFTEGEAIGDRAVLVRLAGEAGLDADEVRAVLASNRYADEVRADETAAQSIGVTGVPFFVFDGRFAVSGAQPVEVLVQVLERALASTAPAESSLPAY